MIRFLITILVLATLAVAGDFLLRNYVEGRAEDQMKAVLDLKTTPEVHVGGWPFTLKAIDGTFPSIDVDLSDARLRGLELEEIQVTLRDVEFSLGSLLLGTEDSVRIGGGTGSAEISEKAIRRALRRQGVPVRVSLADDGSVVVHDDRLPEPVRGDLSLDGRRLIIQAEGLSQSYSLALPKVIEGLHYDSLDVNGTSAELSFSFAAGQLSPV